MHALIALAAFFAPVAAVAQMLIQRGRTAEAVPILRIIAYDPHGGEGAESARQLLTQVDGGDGEGVH
jgi:hypothetical protein